MLDVIIKEWWRDGWCILVPRFVGAPLYERTLFVDCLSVGRPVTGENNLVEGLEIRWGCPVMSSERPVLDRLVSSLKGTTC
jgi:hypothetical protein